MKNFLQISAFFVLFHKILKLIKIKLIITSLKITVIINSTKKADHILKMVMVNVSKIIPEKVG